eukprot:Clim_evm10s15 gene=Clim_evmTU10s15
MTEMDTEEYAAGAHSVGVVRQHSGSVPVPPGWLPLSPRFETIYAHPVKGESFPKLNTLGGTSARVNSNGQPFVPRRVSKPPAGSKAVLHFQTWYFVKEPNANGVALDTSHGVQRVFFKQHPLDSSAHLGLGEPFELVLGKEFLLPFLEAVVSRMTVGDVWELHVPAQYITQYQQFSTLLRRHRLQEAEKKRALEKQKGESKGDLNDHANHSLPIELAGKGGGFRPMCCGMGHDEVQRNADLQQSVGRSQKWRIELKAMYAPGEYKREHWELTVVEKAQEAVKLHAQGNEAIKAGNYQDAITHYATSLAYMSNVIDSRPPEQLQPDLVDKNRAAISEHLVLDDADDDLSEDEQVLMNAAREFSPVYSKSEARMIKVKLNYAICFLKLQRYADCVNLCQEVLNDDPDNVKALLRRGTAHYHRGRDIEDALADFEHVLQLQPNQPDALAHQKSCKAKLAQNEANSKATFARMFK